MDRAKRNSVYTHLTEFAHMSNASDFIEITEWTNGDGFDVNVSTTNGPSSFFQMSYDQFDAMKKLVKGLQKIDRFKNVKDH